MPIVILEEQRRWRELGRIRLGEREPVLIKSGPKAGQQVEKNGKLVFRPKRLADFRLTSPWRHLLEAAKEVYGGEVRPWNPSEGRNEFELATGRPDIDVLVPPGDSLTQWMEEWSGGGCQRRCDGKRMIVAAGKSADRACLCSPENVDPPVPIQDRACSPTSRLSLMVPELPDLGVWRVESHGVNAALEVGAAVELTELATRRGVIVPAVLRIEAREVRKPDEPTKRFVVPVLGFRHGLGETLAALGFGDSKGLALLPGTQPIETRPALNAGGTPELSEGDPPDAREQRPRAIETASLPPSTGGQATDGKTAGSDLTGREGADEEDDVVDAEVIETEPAPFVPPAHDPTEEEGGSSLTPAQFIAIRAREADVDDETRHAAIGIVTRGRTRTGKEVKPDEVPRLVKVFEAIKAGAIKVEHAGEGDATAWTFTDAKGAVMVLNPDNTIGRPDLGEHADAEGNFKKGPNA